MKTPAPKFKTYWHSSLTDYITALAWSPDGQWLAAASAAGEVVLYTLAQERLCLQSASGQAVSALDFSADGQFLALSGQTGTVAVWQLTGSQPQPLSSQPHPGTWIDQLAWHPQQPCLAYGVGSKVRVWAAETQTLLAELTFQASSVLHLAWHPQGECLAVSGHGGVKVWQADDWQAEPKLIAVPGASLYVAWSADGRYLGSGNLDRTLTVAEWQVPPPWLMQGFPGKVRQLAWSDPSATSGAPRLAAACVEAITVWSRGETAKGGWQSQVLQHHRDRVSAIAFQPRSLLLASASQDGQLGFWHQGKKLIQSLKLSGAGLSSLAWHPTGEYLAVGSRTGDVTVCQLASQGKGFG